MTLMLQGGYRTYDDYCGAHLVLSPRAYDAGNRHHPGDSGAADGDTEFGVTRVENVDDVLDEEPENEEEVELDKGHVDLHRWTTV